MVRLRAAGVRLVALFSPEHGFRGAAEPGAAVASSIDSATGLPIYSLYGRTTAPTDAMLAGIDLLLVDLQDAGARYYTYLFTTDRGDARRGAARHAGRRARPPDPIGGAVQGNVLDPAFASPVGISPCRCGYGMTLGELARLARADLGLATALSVVPVAGGGAPCRSDATGLPFVPPSPNLRSIESLYHYPGLCLFEGTNLSVGRGSDAPFEQIGAPWLDTAAVLARMRAAGLPGVPFAATSFTPRGPGDGKYADTAVTGIRLRVTDRNAYDPAATAVHLLAAIRAAHPDRFGWIASAVRPAGRRTGPPGATRGGDRSRGDRGGVGERAQSVPRAAQGSSPVSRMTASAGEADRPPREAPWISRRAQSRTAQHRIEAHAHAATPHRFRLP